MSIRLSVRSSSAFIAGAVVALVIGTGTAYAANGGIFRLGRSNSATATTTLSNTRGSALQLNSKAGQPSLRVNRNTKVPSLNSDLLDGVDSGSFARVTTVGSIFGTGFVDDGGTADPADDAVIALAVCPVGSQVVGGGGGDFTDDGTLFYSAPDGGDAWLVVSSTAGLDATNAADVEAYARCWNPRADVGSNMRMTQAQHAVSSIGRRAIERAAARE
jgi:hypothetical protein